MIDNDVIKALECLKGYAVKCRKCPYSTRFAFPNCQKKVAKDALDLINCQRTTIEEFNAEIESQRAEIDRLNSLATAKDIIIKDIQAEIERLTGLRNSDPMDFCGVLCKYSEELIIKAKSSARKEFAERLKKECLIDSGYEVMQSGTIDNLLKELDKEKAYPIVPDDYNFDVGM